MLQVKAMTQNTRRKSIQNNNYRKRPAKGNSRSYSWQHHVSVKAHAMPTAALLQVKARTAVDSHTNQPNDGDPPRWCSLPGLSVLLQPASMNTSLNTEVCRDSWCG